MADLGRRNALPILRDARPGLYLDGGADGEILLPRRYVTPHTVVGALVDVFVYRDSEDRLVATTETPLAMVGDFAALRVVSVQPNIGAFLAWGLSKDLLLPRREQTSSLHEGDIVVVRVAVDEKSRRIVASSRLNRWLNTAPPMYAPEQAVSLLVCGKTALGYNAIVESAHLGLLYFSDLAQALRIGETIAGYVRMVRPDGKIDLALDRAGYVRVKPLGEQIVEALTAAGGALPFHDKSSPAEIRDKFGVSKKAFKQALGALYRKRRIAIEPTEIRLLEEAAPRKKSPPRRTGN